jgi:hypothetical protein
MVATVLCNAPRAPHRVIALRQLRALVIGVETSMRYMQISAPLHLQT